jgi:hypothetical protein
MSPPSKGGGHGTELCWRTLLLRLPPYARRVFFYCRARRIFVYCRQSNEGRPVRNLKNIARKYKWIIAGAAIAAALCAIAGFMIFRNKNDAMFYEVKCSFPREDANYSLIVDDQTAALAFKNVMEKAENPNDRADSCQLVKYSHATDQTLFVYSVMTVLKNVTFAFKDEIVSEDFYQIQYFSADDTVGALSCSYAGARFDCYNEVPEDGQCPDTLENAKEVLSGKCDFHF